MEDNFVQSFQLESTRLRGRVVRLGSAVDGILSAHDYPADVLHLTGEVLTLCVLLSSMLKYDGIFTLQVQSNGAVKMLVADATTGGDIRACASFSADDFAHETTAQWKDNRAELLGAGHMAFTVDQGEYAERYQGIVELKRESLVSSVQHYFSQSEQIPTGLVVSVGKHDGQWRACGIMIQQMPEETAAYNASQSSVDEDDWRRTMILLGSVTEDEMLSSALGVEELLFRLFHEEGVRIYDPRPLANQCRCNPDKVRRILATMSDDDVASMAVDGKITMTCEFCSKDYIFDPLDIEKGA